MESLRALNRRELAGALEHLSVSDARLGRIIQSVGACKIKKRQDPFQSLAEAIIYQQLAGSAADAIYNRFVKIYGSFPEPAQLLATHSAKLRAAGLSGRKIEYLKDLASHVSDGRLKLSLLASMADDQVVEQLVQVKGIGPWTAEMFLIFCLGRPDVLPVGDLGLRRAMQKTYSLSELPLPAAMQNIAQPWKPYRSIATWYLWKSLEQFKGIG
ncbi:MAG TPA: DNA-3-methyladenine glycosylase [Nitrososphaera sp.]|nr:DNA-3-methyladenine glycosylase [Nitrososphaera sp.]